MEPQSKRVTPEIRKHRIKQMLEQWEARYNGDNDLIPGAPMVTASDMAALEMIRDLLCLIEELQDQIDQLREPPGEPLFNNFDHPSLWGRSR
jgi:translation elongation factor EF-Tu-like GTPase